DELVGQSIDVLNLTPGGPTERAEYMESIRQSESGVLRMETFHRRKDGTVFPVEVSTSLITLGGRDVVLGIDRDITARKRAEALQNAVYHIAQASELVESLSALLAQIQCIISEVMPAENFYFALYDQARNRLSFPYSIDEVDESYSGEEIEAGRGLTAYVLRTGKSLLCTESIHEKLVQQGEIELIGVPSLIWLGVPLIVHSKVIGVMVVQHYSNPHAYGEREQRVLEFVSSQVAMAIDRKQAEEALRESEERYQFANRATFNAIWDWNLQTNALWWNENFQTHFGYCAEEIEPGIESWTNRIHPEDLARVEAGIHAAIDSGQQSWSDHYRFRRKDGTDAEIDDRGYISREASGKPVRMIGAMQDITERKQAEQRAFELALERERMALLSKFVQDASHEFRTPLAIMQANLYLLERIEDPAKRQRKLAQMGEQVTGITRLVDLLAEITRLDSGVPFTTQPADLNGLIGAVAAKLQAQAAAKGLTLHLELASDLPPVSADGNRLGEALHELLNNAVRYTPVGGHITVRSASDADGVTVEVQDSGPGIAADMLPRIFERFYRQDVAHTTPGFGLGLPIARAIVERHGGRLEVESQPGAGSVFRIVLPGSAALLPVGQ
ncbi:MAG: PAS domain S-box protein, partial [Chloroflexi bacterium]|nr:PAS domain S-box protein [Chloroflexota bacterium]